MNPKLILIIGIILSLFSGVASGLTYARRYESEAQITFQTELSSLKNEFESSLDKYSGLVLNLEGFVEGSTEVTRSEWHKYAEIIDLEKNYPGLFFLFLIEKISKDEISAFEEEVRNDKTVNPNGYPDFQIKSLGANSEFGDILYVIKYMEPTNAETEKSLGIDVLTESIRATTVLKAVETRQTAVTDPFNSILNEKSFAMGIPVVDSETNEVESLVGVGFEFEKFFEAHVSNVKLDSLIALEVFDDEVLDEDNRLIYSRQVKSNIDNFSGSFSVQFGDREWEFNVSIPKEKLVNQQGYISVFLIGLLSFLIFLGVTLLIYNLHVGQIRAQSQVGKFSKDLAQSRNFLRALINNYPSVVSVKDVKDRIIMVNPEYEKLTQKKEAELKSRPQSEVYPFSDYVKVQEFDTKVVNNKSLAIFDEVLMLKDGTKTYSTFKFPIQDEDGNVVAICSISSDVSERKNYEQNLKERAEEIEKLNKIMVTREVKMTELKDELEKKVKEIESDSDVVEFN